MQAQNFTFTAYATGGKCAMFVGTTERHNAGEDAVIASIPDDLMEHMRRANEAFAANGGCPGCGSKLIAVHRMPCSAIDDDDLY